MQRVFLVNVDGIEKIVFRIFLALTLFWVIDKSLSFLSRHGDLTQAIIPKPDFSNNERNCKQLKATQFSGIVKARYINYDNQGEFTLEVQIQDSVLLLVGYPIYLENTVEVGDSIIKNSDSFDIYLFKHFNFDSVVVISQDGFDCDYWEKRFRD